MANKLLKAAKRVNTIQKYAKRHPGGSTFRITTYLVENGKLKSNCIQDRKYEYFEFDFQNYQQELRFNQKAERISI